MKIWWHTLALHFSFMSFYFFCFLLIQVHLCPEFVSCCTVFLVALDQFVYNNLPVYNLAKRQFPKWLIHWKQFLERNGFLQIAFWWNGPCSPLDLIYPQELNYHCIIMSPTSILFTYSTCIFPWHVKIYMSKSPLLNSLSSKLFLQYLWSQQKALLVTHFPKSL